jgi:hypothetical protein
MQSRKGKGMQLIRRIAFVLVLTGTVLGVATAEKKEKAPPPEPTVVTVDVTTPTIALTPESKASVTKGGVKISIDTDLFTSNAEIVPVESPFQPGFKEMFHIPCVGTRTGNGMSYYITSFQPQTVVKPEHLVIHLHITNQLPRIFRGAGAVVQMNVQGKSIHLNPEGYGDFVNAIIPPRESQDFDIIGPLVSDLPPRATIGVFLYDVVTKMDDAGNIKEKQDFEWFYSWATQTGTKDVTLPAPTKGCRYN